MTALLSDREAMLRAVLEAPWDDAPRLIYADVIEEVEPERAEFIRLQCELAPWDGKDGSFEPTHLPDLRRREYDLFHADGNRVRWRWGLGGFFRHRLNNRPGMDARDMHALFRRGFIWSVACPSDEFVGRAAALFAAHPITAVRLTDKGPPEPQMVHEWIIGNPKWASRPRGMRTGWRTSLYATNYVGEEQTVIPHELFKHLPARDLETIQQANDALSEACVAYGRQLAGLPPLSPREVTP